ncbi:hypothetical protein CHLRE_08g362350v5 [Chlamydomonas reinhardtii]|uniref:Uncharacterized protein n=1 Tax=Chlamydomonas reinhardtii TaxID=3055 RepID=A0A2K3DGM2_CHLRE|nr:uncharacterized protein CHLRE_08g362350v5 [Chlamydomonas reinhardtii]PNW79672.1 hypothetical protein CHLRE_08g362350v5 [Chlamydomonas reinhardtii]
MTSVEEALPHALLRLFPGTEAANPANYLRRRIALWLAASPDQGRGLGPHTAQLSNVANYLRNEEGALWMNAKLQLPKLKPLLFEAEARGVFLYSCVAGGESTPAPPAATAASFVAKAGDDGGWVTVGAGKGAATADAGASGGSRHRWAGGGRSNGGRDAHLSCRRELVQLDMGVMWRAAQMAPKAAAPGPPAASHTGASAGGGSCNGDCKGGDGRCIPAAPGLAGHSGNGQVMSLQAAPHAGVGPSSSCSGDSSCVAESSGLSPGGNSIASNGKGMSWAAIAATARPERFDTAAATATVAPMRLPAAAGSLPRVITVARHALAAARPREWSTAATSISTGPSGKGAAAAGGTIGIANAAVLRNALLQLFPGTEAANPANYLRRRIALWLAASPDQGRGLGPRTARLSNVANYLRNEEGALWMNAKLQLPKLKPLLFEAEARGVFMYSCVAGGGSGGAAAGRGASRQELVQLEVAAVMGGGSAKAGGNAVVAPELAAPGPKPVATHTSEGSRPGAAATTAAGHEVCAPADTLASGLASPSASFDADWEEATADAAPAAGSGAAGSSAGASSAAAALLPYVLPRAAEICVVADAYSPELIAMLQHCGCCTRIGLAAQAHGDCPTLVSLYAPPALMRLEPVEGCEETVVQWPAAVYLVDPLAAAASYGGSADGDFAAAALLCSLQPLLEEQSVAKVVHGGDRSCGGGRALACLQAAIGAFTGGAASSGGRDGSGVFSIQPLLDTRDGLAALEVSLGLPHAASDSDVPPQMPGASFDSAASHADSSAAVAWLRGLHAHVSRLRDALAGTGLWADRPQLLAALTARHFAALREDAQAALGAAGGDEDAAARVLTRPLGPSQLEVAARAARHLPELWAALEAALLRP